MYSVADSSQPIVGTRLTDDGFMITEACIVRKGIQLYAGDEVNRPDLKIVRVWRSEDEIRDAESMRSFIHATITLGHPPVHINEKNWRDFAKGEISTEAVWDGDRIKLPLIIKDADTISAIQAGTRELSAGYTCDLDFVVGTTPEGEAYDAIQRKIRINHVAVVPKGRAGTRCRIGDEANFEFNTTTDSKRKSEMPQEIQMQTVVLGDQAVQVVASDAPRMELFKTVQAKIVSDAAIAHTAVIAAKDVEIGKLQAENKVLKDAAITPEKLTVLVADRTSLEAVIAKIDDKIVLAGVSDADLRKAAVTAKLGADMTKDASDDVINGMYLVVAADASKVVDQFATVLAAGGAKQVLTDTETADVAYFKSVAAMSDAWKHGSNSQKKEA